MKALVPIEVIEKKILLINGQKVMLDSDLEVPKWYFKLSKKDRFHCPGTSGSVSDQQEAIMSRVKT